MIIEEHYTIAISDDPPHGGAGLYDLEAAAEFSGMHPDMIREFGRAQFVRIAYTSRSGSPYFDRHGVDRLRQIERLRCQRHASLHIIQYITRLLDRLELAERQPSSTRPQAATERNADGVSIGSR